MKNRNADHIRPIRPTMGRGTLMQRYGGKKFLFCLKEVVKNGRDWGADMIRFITATFTELVIIDNGRGMDGDNRDAIFSINTSTATGERQSGKFCTGFKYLMYSFGKLVHVVTAPKDDPGYVYIFEIDVDEHEDILRDEREIIPVRVEKDETTWPHDFPFGTTIRIVYRNPKSAAIRRGTAFAEQLASQLSFAVADVVTVDGERLPERELIGERFIETTPYDKQLGEIGFDLYHPKDLTGDDALQIGALDMGEVPMRNVLSQLGDLRSRVPKTYMLDQVCGTISWSGFRDYINENRETVSSAIGDDPRMLKFVRILEQIEPQVRQRLRIKLASQGDTLEDGPDIQPLLDLLNSTWGGAGPVPGTGSTATTGTTGDPATRQPPSKAAAIQLESDRFEYEIGERVTLRAHISRNYSYRADEIQWHMLRSRGTDIVLSPGQIQFTAAELGNANVRAEIPGSSHVSDANFRFVQKRHVRLNTHNPSIEVDDRHELVLQNADLVGGNIRWEHTGCGELIRNGFRATYTSPAAGSAVVTVYGPNNRVLDKCDIQVGPKRDAGQTVRIRNFTFKVDRMQSESRHDRPVQMYFRGTDAPYHELYINDAAPVLKDVASAGGEWDTVVAMAMMHEFARFANLDARELKYMDVKPEEIPELIERMNSEYWELFAETQRARKRLSS